MLKSLIYVINILWEELDFVVYLILFIFHNTQIMRSGQLSNQFHLKEEYQTLLVTNGQRLHYFYITKRH